MIVDSSALMAILLQEEGFERFARAIAYAERKQIAAPTLVEATMVITGRKFEEGLGLLDEFLRTSGIETIPFTAGHAVVAREAFLRFGKGRHPAALNFGDCIAYAASRLEMMPLLFKGEDFRRTDVEAAI